MKAKADLDMELAIAAKAVRAAVRLKYSNEADREINRVLPEVVNAITVAAAKGEPYQLDISSLFAEGK